MKFYQKSLIYKNTTIVRHWFSSKNWNFAIFFKKVSIDGFTHFSSKIHPKFSKIDFSIYPNILYIYDQNFMLVPTIKLLEFSDKNWETYERLLIFWSIFWLFFLLSKVSKMKFYKKSLIYKNTTLYDIDFPQKIGILRFFLRKFLLTVFHIIYGPNFINFYCPKFQKWNFIKNPWYTKIQHCTTLIFLKKLEFCDFF